MWILYGHSVCFFRRILRFEVAELEEVTDIPLNLDNIDQLSKNEMHKLFLILSDYQQARNKF